MKKSVKIRFSQFILLSILIACSTSPVDKIQGVYIADKDSLKVVMQKNIGGDNTLAVNLLNMAIENAVIEFEIKGDSIKGLMYMVGESELINSKIVTRNDSIIIKVGETEAYLTPTPIGLSYRNSNSDVSIQLRKSEQTKLSEKTEQAIKEKKEYEESLGKWQKGNYVDEFGDKTDKGYVFSLIRGSHENSISMNSEVFVKASIEGESLYFQIFNSSLTIKESFPDSEFGIIKIKYPDGTVKSERIFFYQNTASESPDDKNNLIYNYIIDNDGELKLLIDLGTASEYYTDKYQFTIQKNNLKEILNELKP